jgi:hypothetical protein
MKFYEIEQLKDNTEIKSDGMDLSLMGKVFKILDKKSENKSLDSIMDFNFVFLNKGQGFASDENLVFKHVDKSLKFALVAENTIFQVQDEKLVYFCAIYEGQLLVRCDKAVLENRMKLNSIQGADPVEEKALNWLNTGRVGMSSATMCATLFPNLQKHHKIVDTIIYNGKLDIRWPVDNGDFGRCMKFLEAVPEARERLEELKPLSKEWQGLVENWDKIENLINDGKEIDSYSLIKESLGEKKKLKP